MPIIDRMRLAVLEVNTDRILTRDLVVKEPTVTLNLSGASAMSFKIDHGEATASSFGINWKAWGQWVVPEIETDQYGKIVLTAFLVMRAVPDVKTGDMVVDCVSIMGYPKTIPWLENFNPIAVDPVEVIQRIWAHLESYVNANLGVDVQPSSTGTQMLPGYGYDGSTLSFDFYAMFIRAVDFNDCADQIMQLARDLPLDIIEEVNWNEDRTALTKTLQVGYPYLGLVQEALSFRLGENVITAEVADELAVEPVSDIIIRSWIPGKTYSSMLTNADMTRARRVIMEEAVNISNTERANAWAKRKLTRRNVPKSFQKITIDPNHPNAPFGSWWLADSISIQAPGYPWVGDISSFHRIISITINDKDPTMELGVLDEGAWNYDPITYDPTAAQPQEPTNNLIPNGFFDLSLSGWYQRHGAWIHVITEGRTGEGSARIDLFGAGAELESARFSVNPGETLDFTAWVRFANIIQSSTPAWTFGLVVNTFKNGGRLTSSFLAGFEHDGTAGFMHIGGSYVVPTVDVNELTLSLVVSSDVSSGLAIWDDITCFRPT